MIPCRNHVGVRILNWKPYAALSGIAVFLLVMGGCATQSPAETGAGGIVTPSDESDIRRRARIKLELASGYFDAGKAEIALDEVKQVLALEPDYAEAHNLRGLIFLQLNDLRTAEEALRRSLSLNGRDPNAWHNLGWVYCQQQKWTDSANAFQRALSLPNYAGQPRTYLAMGLCQARAGQPTDAERSLTRAAEMDPSNPIPAYNLALLLHRNRKDQDAQVYIRRLNNSENANAETLWLGIRVERRLGNAETVKQLGDQLRRRFPQSAELTRLDRGSFDE